ncbi:MAG: chemotaxis protein CheB [Desulfofustis sp.]|nr:chemotaxis protein CheB [Desulfofustis sp.]
MEAQTLNYSVNKSIRLLLVDDSELFRRFITELLADTNALTIVGEATDGSEAIKSINRLHPDVVLLDMEMPVMDGMEVLQKVREQVSTPVIMISSLSREGSARCFDTLKNGAVDFIGKDSLHPKKGVDLLKKELLYRILCASRVQSRMISNGLRTGDLAVKDEEEQKRVIFCEECGTRNVIEPQSDGQPPELRCVQCDDLLEAIVISKYRRLSTIGVIGAGRGGAGNLLNIVPLLPESCSTTMIVVMQEATDFIESFTRYLNAVSAVKVIRLEEGMNIEGGNCYIASSQDNFSMVSHSTNYTIRKSPSVSGQGALDLMFESISSILKNKMFAMVLSGHQLDGDKGMQQVRRNQGYGAVLNAASCLCKELGENILRKSAIDRIVDERDCIELLLTYTNGQNSES